MNKFWVSIIFSVLAIIISGIAISITIPHSNFCIDYSGIIVGVLALLVTLLVGWNIYTAIDARDTIKEISALKKIITKELRKIKNEEYALAAITHDASADLYASLLNMSKEKEYKMIRHKLLTINFLSIQERYGECNYHVKDIINVKQSVRKSISKEQYKQLMLIYDSINNKQNIAQLDEVKTIIEQCKI